MSEGGAAQPRREALPLGIFTPDRLGLTVALTVVGFAAAAWVVSSGLLGGVLVMSEQGEMIATGSPALAAMAMIFARPDGAIISSFVATWVVGMIAMMFPAMTPVLVIYNRAYAKSEHGPRLTRLLGTPLFLGGYLVLYAALGGAAFAGVYVAFGLAGAVPALVSYAPLAASITLLAAGVWQVTPFKDACLRHCVSPFGFFFTHARSGLTGALRMGLAHGYYCVGCCWLYMLVMLAVGAMSLPAMAILAGVISVEKVVVRGARWYTRLVAAGFLAAGVVSLLYPNVIFGSV